MKLTRVGVLGAQHPALIDDNGKLRDLSAAAPPDFRLLDRADR
jgi:hypothetical protein